MIVADAAECASLKKNAGWRFEGDVSYAAPPDGVGQCASGRPLYRLYNNSLAGIPNHRYTLRAAVRETMAAKGWLSEGSGPLGVVACVPS